MQINLRFIVMLVPVVSGSKAIMREWKFLQYYRKSRYMFADISLMKKSDIAQAEPHPNGDLDGTDVIRGHQRLG